MAATVQKNAMQFSNEQAASHGWSAMVIQILPHVLRYYPAADCLPACLETTARLYPWHLPSLEMKEARSSGHGMDLTAMWRGVPALPAGVGIRQD